MKKRCVVIGSVEPDIEIKKYIDPGDFVICADGGWVNAKNQGIEPDMIVGDFDSSPRPQSVNADVVVLPVVKDDTDTYHIARYIVENGFTDALFCCVLGGKRIEHTLANIQTLLFLAQNRINATMIDSRSSLIAVSNGEITLPDMPGKYFSVLSLGDLAEGVSITGAKYPLDNYMMKNNYPIGTSNEFDGTDVHISVKKGDILIVITDKD